MAKRILLIALAVALVGAFGVFLSSQLTSGNVCEVCYRPMHEGMSYRIHLAGGDSVDVCCPRCGLRFQEGREDVLGAEVTDFYSSDRLEADQAFYVENSAIHPCSHSQVQEDRSGTQYEVAWDRCLPSFIAFRSRAAAATFRAQNGGVIKSYEELVE